MKLVEPAVQVEKPQVTRTVHGKCHASMDSGQLVEDGAESWADGAHDQSLNSCAACTLVQ